MTGFGERALEQVVGRLRQRRPARLNIRLPIPDDESSDESSSEGSPGSPDSPASTGLPSPGVSTEAASPSTTIDIFPLPSQTLESATTSIAAPSASTRPTVTTTSPAAGTTSTLPSPTALPITVSQSPGQTSRSTSLDLPQTTSTLVVISTSVTGVSPIFSQTLQTKLIQTRSRQTQSTVSDSFHTLPKSSTVFQEPQAIETSPPAREKTRAHETLSHGATIALEVIGSITAVAILLGILFLIYRRIKRRRQKSRSLSTTPQVTPSSPTATTFTSPNQPAMSLAGRVARMRNYLGTGRKASGEVAPAEEANSVVGRAQRLDLVKPELLSEKEKNGTFMKGHQRNVTQDLNVNSGSSRPQLQAYSPQPSDLPQEPLKAVLKRNTIGKLATSFRAQHQAPQDDEEKLISSAHQDDAKTFVHDKRGPIPLIRDADGSIQPLGGWRAKLFWGAGKTKNAQSGAVLGSEKSDDPTLMSGGLRTSNVGLGITANDSVQPEVVKTEAPPRDATNFVGNGGTLKNLAGLRKGDAWVERGVDRQSFVSGMLEGSRTTWGTNVWERLETERELREVRERMEGGMGGEFNLTQRESSVARYRRPVSWIQDQAERRPPLPVPRDNNGPKEDVVGAGVTGIAYESDSEGRQRRK